MWLFEPYGWNTTQISSNGLYYSFHLHLLAHFIHRNAKKNYNLRLNVCLEATYNIIVKHTKTVLWNSYSLKWISFKCYYFFNLYYNSLVLSFVPLCIQSHNGNMLSKQVHCRSFVKYVFFGWHICSYDRKKTNNNNNNINITLYMYENGPVLIFYDRNE